MRSAYGLDSRPDVHWTGRGLCQGRPDDWSSTSWVKKCYAAHVCGHCPVKRECAAELTRTPADFLVGVVMAGVAHGETGRPIGWTPQRVKCGWCYG